jgi:hypothetical protein
MWPNDFPIRAKRMDNDLPGGIEHLAVYRRGVERIRSAWQEFIRKRTEGLTPHPLLGDHPERATGNIAQDLLTGVLD